jgi:hypothetical protein
MSRPLATLLAAAAVLGTALAWLRPGAPLPGAAVVLAVVLLEGGAIRRWARLVGVEIFKTRRTTLFRVGLGGVAALTLLAGFTHERLPDTSGWSMLAGTLGTGFWAAQVFLLVLGATAIAGEASGGTLKMMLPHAYRRSDWIVAKATVLVLAALLFALVAAAVGGAHAATREGLGDVVQTIEPLFPGDEPVREVFATADRMREIAGARVLLGFTALATTALLGLACSALFDSVVAALCFAFFLFAGLELADVLLGLPQSTLQLLYGWYPDRVGRLQDALGRALSERWDEALLGAGLRTATATAGILALLSVRFFARRDVHA